MTTRLIVRPSAERDIAEAFNWYLENAPEHARRFVDELRKEFNRFREAPRLSPSFMATLDERRYELSPT